MAHLLRSRLLQNAGVAHGFNLRTGGSSTGAFQSWNLGRHVGDNAASVDENHRRFATAVGFAPGRLFETEQVHGRAVRRVGPGETEADVRGARADAIVAMGPKLAIGVRVADCVPILVFDASSGAVAAIHAGWRGIVAGVVEAGIAALQPNLRARHEALRAAIFPHIGSCCFEVGEEVAEALSGASPGRRVVDRARSKPHVDLRALVFAKLEALGLATARIDAIAGCTRCDAQRFFSFRRDGQRSGRHIAAIVSA